MAAGDSLDLEENMTIRVGWGNLMKLLSIQIYHIFIVDFYFVSFHVG